MFFAVTYHIFISHFAIFSGKLNILAYFGLDCIHSVIIHIAVGNKRAKTTTGDSKMLIVRFFSPEKLFFSQIKLRCC